MTDYSVDGRAIGRQQLLQLLRDACANASALCEGPPVSEALWQDRARNAIRSCRMLHRGLVNSHPQIADELHILSTEIQIGLAAQSHPSLFGERLQRIRDSILRLQQSRIDSQGPEDRNDRPA